MENRQITNQIIKGNESLSFAPIKCLDLKGWVIIDPNTHHIIYPIFSEEMPYIHEDTVVCKFHQETMKIQISDIIK